MNISKLLLTDTMNTQMNRVNQIIDLLNATGETGKYSVVATQSNLPAINSAPDQLYIVRNHTGIGQACIVFDSTTSGRTWIPLGKSVDSGNTAFKITTAGEYSPSSMRAYYIGSDGLAHAADSTDDNKTATGYMDSQGFLVSWGTIRYAANSGDPVQTLVPGTTYYYNNQGLLTNSPTSSKKVGIAISASLLLINMAGTGSGSSSINTVNSEIELPPIATATSNLYIVKNYTTFKGPAMAAIVDGNYRYSPLKIDPGNGNTFIYVESSSLGSGVGANNLVYLDSNGIWQLANYQLPDKFAQAFLSSNNILVFGGVINLSTGTLVPGQRYYCSSVGTLTTAANANRIGFALNSTTLQIAIDIYANIQPDWNQTNSSATDYIKNKPGVTTTSSYGFAPQLPTDQTTLKFLAQDGTWTELPESIGARIDDIEVSSAGVVTVTITGTYTSIDIKTLSGATIAGTWASNVFTPTTATDITYGVPWKVIVNE